VYDLLVQLTSESTHKLLKNSRSRAFKSDSYEELSVGDKSLDNNSSNRRPSEITNIRPNNPLKNVLQHRKQNENFRRLFRLPEDEELIDSISACYVFEADASSTNAQKIKYPGTLYQSQNFLAFESIETVSLNDHDRSVCTFILPLYTITRFERLNNDTYRSALLFRTWHKMTHVLKIDVSKLRSCFVSSAKHDHVS
jgi:hypothetical protein